MNLGQITFIIMIITITIIIIIIIINIIITIIISYNPRYLLAGNYTMEPTANLTTEASIFRLRRVPYSL
jgi:hypothetical protein